MALGLSCGGCRRRWPCRAARRGGGGGGGGGCRHVQVLHCHHVPRSQVCACFPLPRLSLLHLHGVIFFLPVLCLTALAFLVFFGWFTLAYFVNYSLTSEEGGGDRDLGGGDWQGGKEEEKDVRRVSVTEFAADSDSYLEDVRVQTEEIREVFVDGFFDRPKDMSRMVSPDSCGDEEEDAGGEELVEEVMILETDRQGLKAISELSGSSGRRRLKEMAFDCFMEELEIREFVPSPGAAELFDAQCGEEFSLDRKEVSAYTPPSIDGFVDKHETRAVISGSGHDLEFVVEVDSADASISHGLCSDHEEIKQELNMQELHGSSVPDKLPEVVVQDQEEIENEVTDHSKMLSSNCESKEDSKRQTVGISDEVCSFSNETESSGLPPNSIYLAASNAEPEHEEESTDNNRVEPLGVTSLVCDFVESHQTMEEEISASASEDNVREDTSLETSVSERTEDEDEEIDDYCTSKLNLKGSIS
ncbi:hypothetical protein ACP4OV_015972 [Aristida adscensionis]